MGLFRPDTGTVMKLRCRPALCNQSYALPQSRGCDDRNQAREIVRMNDEAKYGEWLPIETAPNDRRRVDIWRSSWGGERCTDMRRVDLGNGNVFYEAATSGPNCVRDATHWMPIPDPPTGSTP